MKLWSWLCLVVVLWGGSVEAAPRALDERPAAAGEWGFRPAEGARIRRTPPAFSWRPQRGVATYEIQVAEDGDFDAQPLAYAATGIDLSVHCPPRTLDPASYAWRFRALDGAGDATAWSRPRSFEIEPEARAFVVPARDALLARVPSEHPRLFLRPEDLGHLRELAKGPLAAEYERVRRGCDRLVAEPPPTAEPPTYPADVKRGSERWREIWWGNRRYTIRVLESAATLAFVWRIGGDETYGQLAKRLLLDAATWNPRGATGYRYNDEAGMPYAYHFARTYTFLVPLLSAEEKKRCREVMRIRGREMYAHLHPRHLWRPYSSHANRAWHFLGEVAIAFLGEIPEAADWLWFAVNVFGCVYPVWSDDDGGWHEGVNYWSSYVRRFTWWGAVMKHALELDAYDLPYFSEAGYYAMYLMPPGTTGGGFGDLNARVRSARLVDLMALLAHHAKNPHWQWYVDAHGGPRPAPAYYGLLADPGDVPKARSPEDLPASRLFAGTGQAALNGTLLDAKDNVSLLFKSSPFGTQSHGYEAQNAFLLQAFGERLLIRSGRRDHYGSAHHRGWMWHTKSVNSVTVNGRSQILRSPAAVGVITEFYTSPHVDFVEGEAAGAWAKGVKRFTRSILFVKPAHFLIVDRLVADEPSTFEWRLHAPVEMDLVGQTVTVEGERAACDLAILAPTGLSLAQTDRFDPPPRPRVKLREWHLTASTPEPAEEALFVTVMKVRRAGAPRHVDFSLTGAEGGLQVRFGDAVALIGTAPEGGVSANGLRTEADLAVWIGDTEGGEIVRFATDGETLEGAP